MIDRLLTDGTLERAERLGRLLSAFGLPLLALVFLAVLMGWLPSPLLTEVQGVQATLATHDRRVERVIAERTEEARQMIAILGRLTDVLKMIDCGDIMDRALRERCLAR